MLAFVFIFVLECLLCKVTLNPATDLNETLPSLILLTINSGIVLCFLGKAFPGDKERQLNQMLMLSFALRICCMLWDVFGKDIFILPNAEGDAIGYEKIAYSFAFGARKNTVALADYSYWAGQIYKSIGRQPITVQFINVFLAMYSIVLLHKSAVLLNISFQCRKTMVMLLCFLPNFIIITSVFLQESLIAFFICESIYWFTLWWKKNRSSMLILSLLFSLAAGCFHVGGLACCLGYLLMCLFFGGSQRKLTFCLGSLGGYIALLFIVMVIISSHRELFLAKIGGAVSVENVLSQAGATDRASDAEYSVGISGLHPVADIIVNSPIRMFCFLAAPMPWMWRSPKDILAFFGSTLFYLITILEVLKTLRKSVSKQQENDEMRNYLITSLAVLLIAMLMFGWGVSNAGTALRHREKYTCLFVLVYAIAKQQQLDAAQEETDAKCRLN